MEIINICLWVFSCENIKVYTTILLPFIATTLGSALVFVLKNRPGIKLSVIINSIAAGLMTASSIFGLLIPALESKTISGKLSALIGLCIGYLFILVSEKIIGRIKTSEKSLVGITMLIHNIPEGIAVGMVFLGYLRGNGDITFNTAFTLTLGITLQNIPEGAIISIPEHSRGKTKSAAFFKGFLSGAIEPVFSFLTLLAAGVLITFYPFTLSFAAGAMLYAVIQELIPDIFSNESVNRAIPAVMFLLGFLIMLSAECFI